MFKRLSNLIKGFFGLFVGNLEKQNPEALLEVERENLRKQIAQFNQGLAHHAGLCERLIAQVRRNENEVEDLTAKTTAHLQAGNNEVAGEYAMRLQNLEREMEDNRKQLEDAEKTYNDLVKARDVAIKTARQSIEKLTHGLNDLKIKNATAELSEMASGMITEIGGSGDTLNRLHEMVEEGRTKAAGRARLAKDSLDMSDITLKEKEMAALNQHALAAFAAKNNLSVDKKVTEVENPSPQQEEVKPKKSMPITE